MWAQEPTFHVYLLVLSQSPAAPPPSTPWSHPGPAHLPRHHALQAPPTSDHAPRLAPPHIWPRPHIAPAHAWPRPHVWPRPASGHALPLAPPCIWPWPHLAGPGPLRLLELHPGVPAASAPSPAASTREWVGRAHPAWAPARRGRPSAFRPAAARPGCPGRPPPPSPPPMWMQALFEEARRRLPLREEGRAGPEEHSCGRRGVGADQGGRRS